MSARISIDLDETPDATIEVTTGGTHGAGETIWVKLRGGQPGREQERYEVWLSPAQALSLQRGLNSVLMATNGATIEAAGLESVPA